MIPRLEELPAKLVFQRMICPCGGEMKIQPDGWGEIGTERRYPHRCGRCTSVAHLGEMYPRFEQVVIGEDVG